MREEQAAMGLTALGGGNAALEDQRVNLHVAFVPVQRLRDAEGGVVAVGDDGGVELDVVLGVDGWVLDPDLVVFLVGKDREAGGVVAVPVVATEVNESVLYNQGCFTHCWA